MVTEEARWKLIALDPLLYAALWWSIRRDDYGSEMNEVRDLKQR